MSRQRLLLFVAVTFPALCLYLAILPPSVSRAGDCGELIAASYRLGIAHPSGYPIWTVLGRAFAELPFGEIAARYNAFSALCGALAAGTIALAAHRALGFVDEKSSLLKNPLVDEQAFGPNPFVDDFATRWGALGAGWLFAGFYFAASQFVIAEIYALAALWGALLLLFALKWRQEGDWRDAFTLALLAGMAPLVHLSSVFVLPWLLIFAVWKKRGWTWARVALLLVFGLSGLVPALYFPIRSAPFPPPPHVARDLNDTFFLPLDWSHPVSAANLKQHLSAAQYRDLLLTQRTRIVDGKRVTRREFSQPRREVPRRLLEFFGSVALQFGLAAPLVLVGFFRLWKWRALGATLALIWLGNVATQINYDVSDQANFFFPAYLVLALWMGAGWFTVIRALGRRGSLGQKLGPLLLLACVGMQWWLFAIATTERGEFRVRDAAIQQVEGTQNLATPARAVALLVKSDDSLWPIWYAKYVLKRAPDVETPWGRRVREWRENGHLVDYVAQLQRRGPVCLTTWDARTDARFPLQMVSESGNVCVASNRALPTPAAPLNSTDARRRNPSGFVDARFRRAQLWKQPNADAPHVLLDSLAAFDVDWLPLSRPRQNRDFVDGFVQVLIAPRGYFAQTPRPNQREVSTRTRKTTSTKVAWQERRLVLPSNFEPNRVYRASVPLEIEVTLRASPSDVWTRVVADSSDQRTPWTRSDGVVLVQK